MNAWDCGWQSENKSVAKIMYFALLITSVRYHVLYSARENSISVPQLKNWISVGLIHVL